MFLKPGLMLLTLLASTAWAGERLMTEPPGETEPAPPGKEADPAKEGPKAEAKEEARPEADKGATGGDAKPKAKLKAAKEDRQAETRAETRPETQAEAKAEAKAEARAETRAETRAGTKAEAKAEIKAENKADTKADTKAEDTKAEGAKDGQRSEARHDAAREEHRPEVRTEFAQEDRRPEGRGDFARDGGRGEGSALRHADARAEASADPAPEPPAPAFHERLYSMNIRDKEADDSILRLCEAAGVPVEFVSPAADLVTLAFRKVPLRKALELICGAADLQFREKDGKFVVGLGLDLDLQFPKAGEKDLDAIYRCRHMEAEALVQALAKVLPNKVKVTQGPRFQSPAVDSNNDPSGTTGEGGAHALNATDTTFKVHDIILTGPAEQVRRGLMLARKFDRPRKQVRIDVRITEIDDSITSSLGLSWLNPSTGSMNLSATENVPANAATPNMVPGIRVGSFSHSPLQVNATLTALEQQNKSKTLSNPTLLLLDGERSFILSGQKILYPKFTGKDQAGQSIFDTSEVKVGIYLQVAVQIGLSHDVVMSLMPQVTEVTQWTSYNGGVYPTIGTREAQTTVHAYSGEMIALGGLRSHADSVANDGVPFLKDLPFFGKLFNTKTTSKSKTDLVIFLTPRIEDDLDHVEKIPVEVAE